MLVTLGYAPALLLLKSGFELWMIVGWLGVPQRPGFGLINKIVNHD